mmetsp:Transcript_22522/g.10878  ORF Transcript_22522/g.10878 Transcript_22522/m.10878 type:complete len:92 (-) Transcript_22522:221-496(-)
MAIGYIDIANPNVEILTVETPKMYGSRSKVYPLPDRKIGHSIFALFRMEINYNEDWFSDNTVYFYMLDINDETREASITFEYEIDKVKLQL